MGEAFKVIDVTISASMELRVQIISGYRFGKELVSKPVAKFYQIEEENNYVQEFIHQDRNENPKEMLFLELYII